MIDFPPGYVAAVARMVKALQVAVARGRCPRFRLPPPEFTLAASIDEAAPHVCVNDDARNLVPALMHVADGDATCIMLGAALEAAGIGYEVASLAEMGLTEVRGDA